MSLEPPETGGQSAFFLYGFGIFFPSPSLRSPVRRGTVIRSWRGTKPTAGQKRTCPRRETREGTRPPPRVLPGCAAEAGPAPRNIARFLPCVITSVSYAPDPPSRVDPRNSRQPSDAHARGGLHNDFSERSPPARRRFDPSLLGRAFQILNRPRTRVPARRSSESHRIEIRPPPPRLVQQRPANPGGPRRPKVSRGQGAPWQRRLGSVAQAGVMSSPSKAGARLGPRTGDSRCAVCCSGTSRVCSRIEAAPFSRAVSRLLPEFP